MTKLAAKYFNVPFPIKTVFEDLGVEYMIILYRKLFAQSLRITKDFSILFFLSDLAYVGLDLSYMGLD